MLEVSGLTKTYGGLTAVDDVSFSMESGTVVGLIGPNGAGKTTLFDTLTGVAPPDTGRVTFHGSDITGLRPSAVCHRGVVRTFQDVRTFDEERLPTRWELDEAAPDTPVYVPRGAHVAVLNSTALSRVGVDATTDAPDGGTIVLDSGTREPTGVLLEAARTEVVEPVLPERTYREYVEDIKRAMTELNSRGVTAAMEPGVDRTELTAFQDVAVRGEPTVRTGVYVRVYDTADVRDVGEHFVRGFGTDEMRINGVKYMLDGGVEGARLSEPYRAVHGMQEREEYHGHLLLPEGGEEELHDLCRLAAEHGLQVQTHVVGDAALSTLLDIYETAARARDIEPLRWTAMHLFLPTPEQRERMRELGVLATVQYHPAYLGKNMTWLWGRDRASRPVPTRTLLDEGMTVGGGTDAPVVPWHPFEAMWWMVTRKTVSTGQLGTEEGITPRRGTPPLDAGCRVHAPLGGGDRVYRTWKTG